MNYRQRLSLLILNMTTVSLVVAGIGIYILYRTAFEQQKQRLIETAQHQAKLIEAIAKPIDNNILTLDSFLDEYEKFRGLTQTEDFILAKRENNKIIFLVPHQHFNKTHFHAVPWESNLAKPMRKALSGQSGTIIGLDYLGINVLAAYEPIANLNWGVVAKINLAEIRAPFFMAGAYTIFAALIVDLLGAILFLGIGNPMIERLEENEDLNQANQQLSQERNFITNILETTSSLIVVLDQEGRIIRFNRACEEITHYSVDEVKNQRFEEIFLGLQPSEAGTLIQRLLHTSSPSNDVAQFAPQFPKQQESTWLTKEGERLIIAWSNTVILDQEETLKYVIITGSDITQRVAIEEELTWLNQQLEDRVQARTTELQNSNEQLRLEIQERQRLEEALRREIDLLARIMETSPVGIMMANPNGDIILASEQAEQVLELSLTETQQPYNLLEWKISEEEGNTILEEELPFQQVIKTGQPVYGVRQIVELPNQQQRLLSINGCPLLNKEEQIEGVVLTIEDITKQIQVETALIYSEAQFRAIFEQAAVGIGIITLSGRFICVNQRYCELVGYSEVELLSKSYQEIIHPDDVLKNQEFTSQLLSGEIKTGSQEKRYIRQNGQSQWVNLTASTVFDSQGNLEYFIAIVEDISERKKTIENLRQSEEQYRRIIETATEGVWIVDHNNKTTFVNHRMAQMLGYSIEEMKGQSMLNFVASQEKANTANNLEIRHQWVTKHYDSKFLRKDGTDLWTMIAINPIYDLAGNYVGALGMLTDITERKQTEKTLQQVNEQLIARVQELEQRHQDILLLNQVNDFLQACLNIEEAYQVIGELLQPLFPECSGGLFILNNPQTMLEAVATWGESFSSKISFTVDECWALRRGYIHWVKLTQPSLCCPHTHRSSIQIETLCVPMMAQGQAVGLLYLSTSNPDNFSEVKQQLARAVSEHISLALVNLQLRESLESQSIKDSLTELYNRRYMEESLKREINLAQRKQHSLGLIMFDVDHFKQFNDNFGHKAGDLILREISNFLIANVRSSDIACRYGGEEFLLILPEASLADSQQRAEEIRKGIKQLNFQHYNQSFNSITISLGVASFPEHGHNGETLIHAADMALYQAKKQGRDRVVVFSFSS